MDAMTFLAVMVNLKTDFYAATFEDLITPVSKISLRDSDSYRLLVAYRHRPVSLHLVL